MLLMIVHWIGCGWYMIVSPTDSLMPPKDLDNQETDFYVQNMFGKYIEVFYYAVLLMMGNDIAPQTVTQTVYSSLMAIFGSLYGAFLFGNMATLMDSMN